jgi:hypothetical protein
MQTEILTHINAVIIYNKLVEVLPYNPQLKFRSRNLRKAGNYPEVVFGS